MSILGLPAQEPPCTPGLLHYPENARAATVAKYRARLPHAPDRIVQRAALAEDLDQGVGMVLQALDDLDLAGNTYVKYTSDNGAGGSRKRGGIQGGKGSLWEGGLRVPLIVRGPGVPTNSFCDVPVVGYDFFPTFCDLAGVQASLPEGTEGGRLSHLFRGASKYNPKGKSGRTSPTRSK